MSRRRVAVASVLVAVAGVVGAGAAVAYWVTADASSPALAAGDTIPAGSQPTLAGINGQDVSISWPATTTAGGQAVLGYTVARYASAAGGSAVAAGGGCAGTVAAASCTEATVAAGAWYYAVTPRINNWAGVQGARSAAVAVIAPSLTVTTGQIVPALPGTVTGGSLSHFKAGEAVAFHLDTAAGTTLAASISTVDGAGQATGFTVTISAGAVDGTHALVAVGAGGSQATGNAFIVLTAPLVVSVDSVSKTLLGPADASTVVTWHADESGTYSVRVGGSTCATGTSVAGAAYTTPASVATTVSASALAEGSNTVRICVTGASTHVGVATTTVSLDTQPPAGGSVSYTTGYYGSQAVAVTLATGTDAVSGVASTGQVLQRAVTGLSNGVCTPAFGSFATLATNPASVYTDTTVVSGNCYMYRYVVVDNGANAVTYTSSGVAKVDATPPTFASTPLVLTAGASSFVSGTTVFYNSNVTAGFTVTAQGPADAESTVTKVNFPAVGSGVSGGGDQTAAPYAATYSTTAGASGSGARTVTATNGALLTSAAGFTVTPDGAAPAGGALTVNGGSASSAGTSTYTTSGNFSITRTEFTDAGAGLVTSTLTRATASITNNTCGLFGTPGVLTGTPSQTVTTGCYRYVLTGTDNVGNTASLTTIVMVDTSAPATPTLALSGLANAYYSAAGPTLYIRPAAGGTFTVTASSTDADTGVASYTFGSLNGNGGANFVNTQTAGVNAYTFGASTTVPSTAVGVIATNGAGGASGRASYSVVADITAPTAPAPTVTAGYYTSASVAVGLSTATDAGSGVASSVLQRDQVALPGNACGTFPGTFGTTISLAGGNDTTVASGFCYQYHLRVTDNVGNQATSTLSGIAKVDTSGPTTPALTFSSMTSGGASGTTVYVRSGQSSGTFTVNASSTDPETGVSYAFPTFGTGWTVSGTGASRTYAWSSANPTVPSGNQTITSTNGAGLTASRSFTVVADNTSPSVSNVVLANGGTSSTIDQGDTATVTFSEQLDAAKLCPSWTNGVVQTLSDVVITVVNQGGHDEVSLTSPSCAVLNFATAASPVNTNANYVTQGLTVVFTGTITWNPGANTVTITFGTVTSGAGSLKTGVTSNQAKYGPPAGLTDVAGNPLPVSNTTGQANSSF